MEKTVIKYLIADDHELFREGFQALLDSDGNYECIGQAKDGAELLSLFKELRPQAVILDYRMPGMDGLETLQELRKLSSDLPVLMLTVDEHPYLMYRMLKAGTNGILLKGEATVLDARRALSDLAEHGCYFNSHFNPRAIAKFLSGERKARGKPADFSPLSEREILVLRYICAGHTTVQIGKAIHASPRTVDRIRIFLFEKTKTTHIGELVIFAIQAGLFDPERHAEKSK